MTDETTPESAETEDSVEAPTVEAEVPEVAAEAPEVAATTEDVVEETTAAAEPEVPDAVPSIADGLSIGSSAPADVTEMPRIAPTIRGKIDRFGTAIGTGRRKTSVARVRVKPGDGKLTINGRSLDQYCGVERDRAMVMAPLVATDRVGKVDVWIRVNGGGTTGQTGAIVLGIARALQAKEPDLHQALSEKGFLTRDGRMVERKKYGLKKARKSFQFSKR
jgi:small subunit ribosomal protein S9